MAISLARHRHTAYHFNNEPKVIVILPCKGIDFQMESNITSILEQKYSNFSVIGVVDSDDDPALPILKDQGIEFLIADSDCKGCSGKVRAIATVFESHLECDVYVVVDSDTRVGDRWLRNLVAPLVDEKIGVSTTFPVFVPDGGIWSVVKAAWGMVGAGMMESKLTRFVWGGSMAFRSSMIDGTSLKKFKKMVSDDVAIMNIAKERGLSIEYVKKAAPKIHSPDDFRTFFEWANRQTALSVSGSRKILKYGLTFYGLQIFLLVSAILLGYFVAITAFLFLIPFFISAFRNAYRSVKRKGTMFVISFLMPFIYFVNLVIAGRMSNIKWRGNVYRLN